MIFTPQASASYSNEPKSRRRARILGLATAVALSSIGLSFADQPAAPLDRPILASSLVQAAANPGELLQQGIEQFNRKEYEEAVSTLQQVDASSLPDAQKQTLASTLAQAQSAANQRKAARAAFEQGETALGAGDPAAAIVQYRSVINNTFADAGTRAKATEQLALATADLQARGLPVPAEGAAPAAPTVTDPVQQAKAKEAYDAGVAAYNAGDFPLARQKFTEAGELGYVAGTFETAPAKYVEMIEHKDQLDALRAARAAIADMRSARQPEPAPAVEPVPSAPQTTSPAVVQDTPPAVEPTPSVEPAPAGTDLAAAARAEQLARAQARIEAEKLVQQAEVAVAAGRFTEAGSLYDQAIRLDPENQRAIAGRNDIVRQLGLSPVQEGIAERMEREVRATRDRISFLFNTNLNIAGQSIEAGDFGTAEAAIQSAEVASLSNPTVFTQAEVNNFSNRIAVTRRALAGARQEALARATAEQQAEAARTLAEREREFQRQRGEALTTLRRDARRLSEQGNYEEAIAVVDQILAIDRNDDYATGVRPLLLDRVHINKQKEYRDRWHTNMVEQFIEAEEKKIPYSDILNYPANWPDLSERRERTVEQERGGTQQDSEARALLDRELPELRFDQVPFADAIEFLRDSTQANIFVNWRAMELEAVDRNAPVSLRLRNVKFSKVLRSILDDVGGGTVKLGYTIDEGVITISTLDDLAQNVDTRVYDIRDLIINIPDFTNAPEFNLDGGNGQGGTGGGQGGGLGGGGGGGGLFGGGGGGGGGGRGGGGGDDEDEGPSRAELVEDIILLITETIATDTWKDNGGTIGSLRELQGQLIVTQTPENQNAIAALLEKLRETRAIQVNIETRFLTVARNFLEDVGVDFDFAFNYNNTFGWNQAAPIVNPSTGLPLRPINSSGQGVNVAPVTVSQNSLGFTAPNTLETGLPGNLSGSFATPNFSTSINAFLDDFQASLLIRASQGSRTLTTLTAPRVTLFNGQRAYVFIGLQQAYVSDLQPVVGSGAVGFNPTVATLSTGVVLDVTATVSADRKYVTLTLRPQLTRLLGLQVFPVFGGTVFGGGGDGGGGGGGGEEPVSGVGFIQLPQIEITEVRTTVSVPDGGTLLLGGQTVAAEIDREAGVPVLSKVPFLKRLFTNRSMAKDESVLLILVKPTIIIQREIEEERYPGLDR